MITHCRCHASWHEDPNCADCLRANEKLAETARELSPTDWRLLKEVHEAGALYVPKDAAEAAYIEENLRGHLHQTWVNERRAGKTMPGPKGYLLTRYGQDLVAARGAS